METHGEVANRLVGYIEILQVKLAQEKVFPRLLLAVQLFASFAEHYYTFGLLSGIVTGRSALGDAGDGASIYAEEGLKGDPFLLASGGGEGDDLPPAPPTFNAVALEAPSPPPGEYYLAKRIVADMSLSIGAIMVFGFAICAL